MPYKNHCCCCPTKEEAGLPDELTMTLEVVTSGDDTGMPSDSVILSGVCSEDVYERWSVSTALADALGSILFDYVGTGPGTGDCAQACCFNYEGRASYTFDPGNALGSGYDSPTVPLGDAPFTDLYLDGFHNYYECTEAVENQDFDTCTYDACDNPPGPCCQGCPDPATIYGTLLDSWDGVQIEFSPLFGVANLTICINGQVVTICGTIEVHEAYTRREGGETYERGGISNSVEPCPPSGDLHTTSFTEAAYSLNGGLPIATFPFSMTADLSVVSGATIWDKIKNYIDWRFDYAYAACSTNYGCGSDETICIGPCEILPNCFVQLPTCENREDCNPLNTVHGGAVDEQCLYNYGTMAATFS